MCVSGTDPPPACPCATTSRCLHVAWSFGHLQPGDVSIKNTFKSIIHTHIPPGRYGLGGLSFPAFIAAAKEKAAGTMKTRPESSSIVCLYGVSGQLVAETHPKHIRVALRRLSIVPLAGCACKTHL